MGKSTLVLERVDRQRLSHVVAERLLEKLERENLQPGERLPSERELMAMLRVGRSTVREALNGLALAGVIEIRHGQGCFVASRAKPAPRALELALRRGVTAELMEARLVVEVEMAGLAAERATSDDIADLERTIGDYEIAVGAGASTVRHAARLHEQLLAASHSEVLIGFVRTYMPKVLERGDELERAGPGDVAKEFDEHRSLFEAVRDRRADLARRRMHDHLCAMAEQFERAEQA